jgi:iron complex transport system ATP-binding protein
MSLVKAYVENTDGRTPRGALVVLHDIALAAKYADRLIWMKDGEIVADGSTKETVTAQRLADVYGVHARIENNDVYIDSYL